MNSWGTTLGARGGHPGPRSLFPSPPHRPPAGAGSPPWARPPRAMLAGRGGGAGPGAQFSGKECLARRGRPRPPRPRKPGRPPRASFIAALKPGSGPRMTHPRPLAADPRALPGRHHRDPRPRAGAKPGRVPRGGGARAPPPRRRGAPCPLLAPLPAPPARSLPSPLHNSKACQAGSRLLAPGSAPGKKKKKEKEKGEKAGAREREGERKARGAKLCATCAHSTAAPVPSPASPSPNPNGEPHTPRGRGRARSTDQLFMGESII